MKVLRLQATSLPSVLPGGHYIFLSSGVVGLRGAQGENQDA